MKVLGVKLQNVFQKKSLKHFEYRNCLFFVSHAGYFQTYSCQIVKKTGLIRFEHVRRKKLNLIYTHIMK